MKSMSYNSKKSTIAKKTYDRKPYFSIITVVYNGEQYLEATIKSIIKQTYNNIEYIIIDGGSNDATLNIIRNYDGFIDYWVSEKDEGIYDAMNKGLQACNGEYVWFMNAGDRIFKNNTIETIVHLYPDADVYYGSTELIDHSGNTIKLVQVPSKLTWKSFLHGMVVSHQSIIIKKSLVNLYDLQYQYVSDHDWIVDALQKANTIIYAKIPLSKYLVDGFSQQNFESCWQEKFKIVKKYHGLFGLFLTYYYYSVTKMKRVIKSKLRKI